MLAGIRNIGQQIEILLILKILFNHTCQIE